VSATTKIEWCDATWNPVTGCTPCSPGCDHCYAANMVRRFPHLHDSCIDAVHACAAKPLPFSCVQFHLSRLDQPFHWRRPRRVFVCSMGDLFHDDMAANWTRYVFHTMRSIRGQHHTYLLLTKRAENARSWMTMLQLSSDTLWPLPNLWLGVTVCNQAEADAKIPVLLQTPAALRFVSIEPMLGPVDLACWLRPCSYPGGTADDDRCLDWVIVGGETGPGARPLSPIAGCDLRDQCVSAGVPFFWKGCGTAWLPKSHPNYHLLDGREWHQFPEVHP
jgi:protein gp37